jgi:hypothetical protein
MCVALNHVLGLNFIHAPSNGIAFHLRGYDHTASRARPSHRTRLEAI